MILKIIVVFLIVLFVSILISAFLGMDNSQVPGNTGFTDYEDFFPSNKDNQ